MRAIEQGWAVGLLTAALLCAVARPSVACVGDCDGNGRVSVAELVRGVSIALGTATVDLCEALDNDRDGAIVVNELVRGVNKALSSCSLGPAGEVLISSVGQLDETDIGTGASTALVNPPQAVATGQVCLLPGGSGDFVSGDLRGVPADTPSTWSVFSSDGTFVRALAIPGIDDKPAATPVGCAVDPQGRLFGTVRFATPADPGTGAVVVYFPPDYATSCMLSPTGAPGDIAIDDAGTLYIPQTANENGALPGIVLQLAGPFPNNAAECASVTPAKTTFISYDDAFPARGIARGSDGHFFVAVGGYSASTLPRGIREHAADGSFVREILPAAKGGNPLSLAFDSTGSLYYQDLTLQDQGAGTWTLRKIAFDDTAKPAEPELVDSGSGLPTGLAVFPSRADEWLTLGGSLRRTYFNPRERVLNKNSADNLIVQWQYLTSGMISAQPVVTWVDLPGEGRTQIVIVPSWDRYVNAVRADNGSQVWRFQMKPQPGAAYPYAASATIAWVDGQQRVFVPGGETAYCLDAVSGQKIWEFDAGTGCTDCMARQERNEIESTPAVVDGLVLLAMDTNDGVPGKGGMFALRADDGRLVWWFDLVTTQTCYPSPEDDIRRFDGFHSEADLGLPENFFTTRSGCDFDRTSTACGNVWSSVAVDARRRLLYTVSGNCDVDDDPSTPPPPPPMPPYEEAIFAVRLDGTPAWVWRPREVDPEDFDFGAVPNLFEAEIGGEMREVVGVGGKDGTYYVLDRDGTNELTGRIEPYWQTNVVPGGPAGGMIGAASVGEGRVVVCTAPGFSPLTPQKPSVHAFNADTGEIDWQFTATDTCFGPTMGVPGVAITGGTPRPILNLFDRDAGMLVNALIATNAISGIASGPTIVGGKVFVGGGTGAFNEGSEAEQQATHDTPITALCVRGTPGCAANTCNDGNVCTYDYRNNNGDCVSEPSAEDLDCLTGGMPGTCHAGVCTVASP
jgi:outer membrane protein assembly factor BamB